MTTKEMIAVLQAYEEGKQIQLCVKNRFEPKCWKDIPEPSWNFPDCDYRIKPEPKRRPYANAKEFLQAQKEHGPYITNGKSFTLPCYVYKNGVKNIDKGDETFAEILEKGRKWQDGTPCGIIEEEQP